MPPQASVILALYNDIPLLRLALAALDAQVDGRFEVLIADDGSSDHAKSQIAQWQSRYRFSLKHLWHPDQGFRKTVILNQAVMASQGKTLIFIDADCVPQAQFVSDHLRHAAAGICQTGRRVDVFRDAVDLLDCSHPEQILRRNRMKLLGWSLQGKARNIEKGIRLPTALARQLGGRPWGALGCNFSMQRDDLIAINGFDERHDEQWGAEDSDVERRLKMHGVRCHGLRYQATMIHFDASFYKRGPSEDAARRWQHYLAAEAENRIWTPYGICKQDREDPQ